MSLNDAYAFANSLAGTLMVAIIIFRAGDGTLSVTPCNEFDGDAETGAAWSAPSSSAPLPPVSHSASASFCSPSCGRPG